LHWQRVTEPVDDDNPDLAASALNREIERVVLARPEQYQWTYKRFSRQAKGQANPYSSQH
jgi:KDO2-lipid IV(A) lauroyltransferase